MLVRIAAAVLIGSAAACSLARVAVPGREAAPDAAPYPGPASPAEPATTETSSGFHTEVRPILESRCRPCHFEGGKVYDRYPFDRPETIRALGVKLFTRIRDEQERAAIKRFLEAVPDGP